MDTNGIKKLYDEYVLSTYVRQDLCLVKGKGVWVEDIEGKKYLDLFPGWAVSGTGHCHPKVVERIENQLKKIMHVSNNFYSENQPQLAKKIIEHSFSGKVFFSNSGAEANEGAIKFARKYGSSSSRYEIITMEKSFHGRTLATLTATGQDKVKKGFAPLPEGFKHVPFNDIKAFSSAITEKTIAVMIEPIQGEGGINVPGKAYMKELERICRKKDILLICDEVQTGMGRTGKMFAFSHFGIEPDAITLAKALGGGMPIGALVVNKKHDGVLTPGSHATTFGGSPIACAAALGVFDAIEQEKLLENADKMGKYLMEAIKNMADPKGRIKEIRGIGLMIGVELNTEEGTAIAEACMKEGLLLNCTQGNVLRIMPPINIKKEEADMAIGKLSKVMEHI